MEAIEIFEKHRQLLTVWKNEQYLPQARTLEVKEIEQGMKLLNPSYQLKGSCSGCVQELLNMAYALLINNDKKKEVKEQPKFMTFPAHEPKKRGRKPKA